ncbi:MAG: hypothetical protein NVSMB25_10540 [Thermoleophilaceae bacterium]
MPLAIAIVLILVIGAIVGTTLNFAGLFLGIPIALMAIGAVVGKEELSRQSRIRKMKRFRRDARAQKVQFTDADKRTVI